MLPRQVVIKSLRELAESGGSTLPTIEKYVRQSFAGATDVNLSKLLRLAAHKAVAKVRKSTANFVQSLKKAFVAFFSRVCYRKMATITRSQLAKTQRHRVGNVGLRLLRQHPSLTVMTQIFQTVIPAIHWMTMKNLTTCIIGRIVR